MICMIKITKSLDIKKIYAEHYMRYEIQKHIIQRRISESGKEDPNMDRH